jgi:hypothetical protein
MYPVSYAADYLAEGRNRLTTFFRYFVAIPWLIVAYLYGVGASIVATIAWFAMVFTGRYPQQLYDFNAGYLRMITRTNAFNYLLTDEYPPFGGEEAPGYPVRVGIAPPLDKYSRAKAFFRYLIGIPVLFLAVVQGVILFVVTVLAWFAILFTGRHPEGLFNPARSALAYLTRAGAYFMLMTETYPPFSLEQGDAVAAGEISQEAASRRA